MYTMRLTRVLFGLVFSPYQIHNVIKAHLDSWSKTNPEKVEQLRQSMFVDNPLSDGVTCEQAKTGKGIAKKVFQDAMFELHKWSSNVPQSEIGEAQQELEVLAKQPHAKEQLMVKPAESKVLATRRKLVELMQ